MILPEWIKTEESIYSRFKDLRSIAPNVNAGIDDFRTHYLRHIQIKNEDWREGSYYAGPSSWYVDIPSGIEIDNNLLKPITFAIVNWERQFYIPWVFEMCNNQDYPKNLIEVLIVDDDTKNKDEVLNIIKEQTKLYPNLRTRFIQSYQQKTQVTRQNIAVRHASNDIVIINETDNLPLGKNYFRGISYAHSKFKNVSCTGIPFGLGTLDNIEKGECCISNRFGNGVFSFDKELFSKIQGYDEKHIGWGGHEGNIFSRYISVGGKIFINLDIYSGNLTNFPVPLPSGVIPAGPGRNDDWQQGTVINDSNWGISKMKEINLYEN